MDEGLIASEDIIGRQTDIEGFYLFCYSEIQEEFRFVKVSLKSSITIEVKAAFDLPTGFVLPEQFGKSIASPVAYFCRMQADIAGSCVIYCPPPRTVSNKPESRISTLPSAANPASNCDSP